MATYTAKNGKIRVRIRRNGASKSATFDTKSEAKVWAALQERGVEVDTQIAAAQIAEGKYYPANFAEILNKYCDKVTPMKKTAKAESAMIDCLLRDAPFMSVPIHQLETIHFNDFRDQRLRKVKAATVSRQFDILRAACKYCKEQLKWWTPSENLALCKTPVPHQKAFRRIEDDVFDVVFQAAKKSRNNYLIDAIKLAVETGMRRGEVANLKWVDVDLQRSLITVRDTKTGHDRVVVMSPNARKVFEARENKTGKVLGTSNNALKLAWQRCKKRAGVSIRFHDLRHEACSRFFEMGFNPAEVSSLSGHLTLSSLMRYSHATQDKILKRMNEVQS